MGRQTVNSVTGINIYRSINQDLRISPQHPKWVCIYHPVLGNTTHFQSNNISIPRVQQSEHLQALLWRMYLYVKYFAELRKQSLATTSNNHSTGICPSGWPQRQSYCAVFFFFGLINFIEFFFGHLLTRLDLFSLEQHVSCIYLNATCNQCVFWFSSLWFLKISFRTVCKSLLLTILTRIFVMSYTVIQCRAMQSI